jgi:aminomethyltransferase
MNKHLVGLELAGESVPKRGRPIVASGPASGTESKAIGIVTSAVKSPTLGKVIAIGYVHRDFTPPGSKVEIDGTSAEVTSLPFYRRGPSSGG